MVQSCVSYYCLQGFGDFWSLHSSAPVWRQNLYVVLDYTLKDSPSIAQFGANISLYPAQYLLLWGMCLLEILSCCRKSFQMSSWTCDLYLGSSAFQHLIKFKPLPPQTSEPSLVSPMKKYSPAHSRGEIGEFQTSGFLAGLCFSCPNCDSRVYYLSALLGRQVDGFKVDFSSPAGST